jgi:hypothetical protein
MPKSRKVRLEKTRLTDESLDSLDNVVSFLNTLSKDLKKVDKDIKKARRSIARFKEIKTEELRARE